MEQKKVSQVAQVSQVPQAAEKASDTRGTRGIFGFSIIELVIAIGFLALLALSVVFAINPLERAKVKIDNTLKDRAEDLLAAINQFYIAEGRLPWADDFGADTLLPGLSWRSVLSPEVGICGDLRCSQVGELITTNKLGSGFAADIAKNVGAESFYTKVSASSTLFIAKGNEPKGPVYVCYLPQSETLRRATGKLYRITPGEPIPPSGVPEDCPLSVTWEKDDVCWGCVSR